MTRSPKEKKIARRKKPAYLSSGIYRVKKKANGETSELRKDVNEKITIVVHGGVSSVAQGPNTAVGKRRGNCWGDHEGEQ